MKDDKVGRLRVRRSAARGVYYVTVMTEDGPRVVSVQPTVIKARARAAAIMIERKAAKRRRRDR